MFLSIKTFVVATRTALDLGNERCFNRRVTKHFDLNILEQRTTLKKRKNLRFRSRGRRWKRKWNGGYDKRSHEFLRLFLLSEAWLETSECHKPTSQSLSLHLPLSATQTHTHTQRQRWRRTQRQHIICKHSHSVLLPRQRLRGPVWTEMVLIIRPHSKPQLVLNTTHYTHTSCTCLNRWKGRDHNVCLRADAVCASRLGEGNLHVVVLAMHTLCSWCYIPV